VGGNPFARELVSGERLVWRGQPDPSVLFTPADLFLVPFSLLWGGFAIFWETSVLGMWGSSAGGGGPPVFFALWGVPFVLMGLYFIAGRFVYKAWRKRRTFYAVTDRRVLILTRLWRTSLQSLYLDQLPGLEKSVRGDGSGSITFGSPSFWAGAYANSGMELFGQSRGAVAPAFHDVPNVERVYRLIRDLREGRPNGGAPSV